MTITFWLQVKKGGGIGSVDNGIVFSIREPLKKNTAAEADTISSTTPTDIKHYAAFGWDGEREPWTKHLPFKFFYRTVGGGQQAYSGLTSSTGATHSNALFTSALVRKVGTNDITDKLTDDAGRQARSDQSSYIKYIMSHRRQFLFVAIRMNAASNNITFNFGTQNPDAASPDDDIRPFRGVRVLSTNHEMTSIMDSSITSTATYEMPPANSLLTLFTPGDVTTRDTVGGKGDASLDGVGNTAAAGNNISISPINLDGGKSTHLRGMPGAAASSYIEDFRIYGQKLTDDQLSGIYSNAGNAKGTILESPYGKPVDDVLPYLHMDFDTVTTAPTYAIGGTVPVITRGSIVNPSLGVGVAELTDSLRHLKTTFYTDSVNRLDPRMSGSGSALNLQGEDLNSFPRISHKIS